MERVFCPRHTEKTPSCVVYEDHAYCYGGCGRIPLSELGKDVVVPVKKPPVDIRSELVRIGELPRASVRGLSLPVDATGYYIVWPSGDYFKKRRFIGSNGDKYYCPRGHRKPPFWALEPQGADTLFIVEGELNALSLATLKPKAAIMSPGGVGDFKEEVIKYLQFKKYCLILDKDKPGLNAGLALRKELIKKTPYVEITLLETDLNQLLQDGLLEAEAKKRGWV